MTSTPAAAVTVNSSLLASIRYEADAAFLHLEFRDGALYRYFGVPAEIYEGLLAASSKGVYFNRRIRGLFQYALLRRSA
jgi:KTSC domain